MLVGNNKNFPPAQHYNKYGHNGAVGNNEEASFSDSDADEVEEHGHHDRDEGDDDSDYEEGELDSA